MASSTKAKPTPKMASSRRQTQPAGWNPFLAGSGIGLLPRRGLTETEFLTTKSALMRLGRGNPLKLLSHLPDIHPSVGLATWNALRLTCMPGDMTIKAIAPRGGKKTSERGTEAIDALWKSLPNEIGGLMGLQTTLTLLALFTGMPCVEGVPGPPMTGLSDVWPVDPLTIKFDRDPVTTRAIPWQRQIFPKDGMPPVDYMGGYRKISTDTFFWRTVDPWADDLYGRAPYAPVLNEVLCDLAMIQDLRDAIHNAAWPRMGHGFNFAEMYKTAVEVMGINDPTEAANWVQDRFDELVAKASSLKADDNIFYDAAGALQILEGGKGFAALKEILVYLRQRIVQALKTLPTLMGINDGATQTYTTVEWQIYAAGLQTIQALVAELLVEIASLHLRLLGMPLVAVAEYTSIRTTDALIEAQTESTRIENAKKKILLGWISNEDACLSITGTLPIAEPMPGALEPSSSDSGGSRDAPKADKPAKAGTTQEEQDATGDENSAD